MGDFLEYLEERAGVKVKPSVTKGHTRVYKDGKIIRVDPFMTIRKVSKSGHMEVHFDKDKDPVKIKTILNALFDPKVSMRHKKIILSHIRIMVSRRVKYAQLSVENGKLVLTVNPKYIHAKDNKEKLDK